MRYGVDVTTELANSITRSLSSFTTNVRCFIIAFECFWYFWPLVRACSIDHKFLLLRLLFSHSTRVWKGTHLRSVHVVGICAQIMGGAKPNSAVFLWQIFTWSWIISPYIVIKFKLTSKCVYNLSFQIVPGREFLFVVCVSLLNFDLVLLLSLLRQLPLSSFLVTMLPGHHPDYFILRSSHQSRHCCFCSC